MSDMIGENGLNLPLLSPDEVDTSVCQRESRSYTRIVKIVTGVWVLSAVTVIALFMLEDGHGAWNDLIENTKDLAVNLQDDWQTTIQWFHKSAKEIPADCFTATPHDDANDDAASKYRFRGRDNHYNEEKENEHQDTRLNTAEASSYDATEITEAPFDESTSNDIKDNDGDDDEFASNNDSTGHDALLLYGGARHHDTQSHDKIEEYTALDDNFMGYHTTELTEANFKAWLQEHDTVFVVMFAPWCVWCQRLSPVWAMFTEEVMKLEMPIGVGKVDCMAQSILCRNEKVLAFPTLRWYQNGQAVFPDFRMDRTVEGLMDFAQARLSMSDELQDADTHTKKDLYIESQDLVQGEIGIMTKDELEGDDDRNDDGDFNYHSNRINEEGREGNDVEASAVDLMNDEAANYYFNLYNRKVVFDPTGSAEDLNDSDGSYEKENDDEIYPNRFDDYYEKDNDDDVSLEDSRSQDEASDVTNARDTTSDQALSILDESIAGLDVIDLTDANFKMWLQENEMVFVDFFAPWCEWSKELAPIWQKFAQEVKNLELPIGVGKVDCMAQEKLCQTERILAFPTLRWYQNGQVIFPSFTTDRTVAALMDFVQLKLEMNASRLKQADMHTKRDSNDEKPASNQDFFLEYPISNSKDTNDEKIDLSVDGSSVVYDTYSSVVVPVSFDLDETNWDTVHQTDEPVMVNFFAPWSIWSQHLLPIWNNFGQKVRDENFPVVVGQVDCVSHFDLCRREGVSAYPTVRWYKHGKMIDENNRPKRSVEGLLQYTSMRLVGEATTSQTTGTSTSTES